MTGPSHSADFRKLATQLFNLKNNPGAGTCALLIGEAASAVPFPLIRRAVLEAGGLTESDIDGMGELKLDDEFRKAWSALAVSAKFATVNRIVAKATATATDDYRALVRAFDKVAQLVKEGYFNLIFTTNVDSMLEGALTRAELHQGPSYHVLINGRDDQATIAERLADPEPRIKIVKLHGDLYTRTMAFGYSEVRGFVDRVEQLVSGHLSGPLLIAGSTVRDLDVGRCVKADGDALYYVNPVLPAMGTPLYDVLQTRPCVCVTGEEAGFCAFFEALSDRLLGDPETGKTGMETLKQVGVPVEELSEEQVESALADTPLVEILEPEEPESGPGVVELLRPTLLRIVNTADGRARFSVSGPVINYESAADRSVRLGVAMLAEMSRQLGEDIARLRREKNAAGRRNWRARAKSEGQRLYQDLILNFPELNQKWGMTQGACKRDPETLELCFSGPRDYMAVPYELLDDQLPLAVRHPLYRSVLDVHCNAVPSVPELLAAAYEKHDRPVRFLLVSGDPHLRTDQEVTELDALIRAKAAGLRIAVTVVPILAADATESRVKRELESHAYDVIHFAGHGGFDPNRPERSGIYVADGVCVSTNYLHAALDGSPAALFYLNTCRGAAVGGAADLVCNDHIGVSDALVHAGVPVVLGFRWAVDDEGAKTFALDFYRALFATRSPAVATLRARKAVYGSAAPASGPDDETWLSPILVIQKPQTQ